MKIDRKNKWRMAVKKVGSLSPPRGRYGGLRKFSNLTINRLNGIAILTRSLGCIWSYGKCYRNPPLAPPYKSVNKFFNKLKDNKQINLTRNIVTMYSTFLRLNLRKWSQGTVSPPERILNETVGSYRVETRHYLAEVV